MWWKVCGCYTMRWFQWILSTAPVHPKGEQSWVFIGRTDAEAETPVLWLPHAKSWLIGKDPDAGRDRGQEEKGMTEDEMTGWTWVWVNSGSWWWTGGPGVLRFMGSQRVGHDWVAELKHSTAHTSVLTKILCFKVRQSLLRACFSGSSPKMIQFTLTNHTL